MLPNTYNLLLPGSFFESQCGMLDRLLARNSLEGDNGKPLHEHLTYLKNFIRINISQSQLDGT